MPLSDLVYRHRSLAKKAISASRRLLPETLHKQIRGLAERVAFSLTPQYQGDTLPPINSPPPRMTPAIEYSV